MQVSDGETWIQYNSQDNLWRCCGDSGCNCTVTSETFTAVNPGAWTAVASTQAIATVISSSTIASSVSATQSVGETVAPSTNGMNDRAG